MFSPLLLHVEDFFISPYLNSQVDPLTGEGIHLAMKGARIAADCVGEMFLSGNFSLAASGRRRLLYLNTYIHTYTHTYIQTNYIYFYIHTYNTYIRTYINTCIDIYLHV